MVLKKCPTLLFIKLYSIQYWVYIQCARLYTVEMPTGLGRVIPETLVNNSMFPSALLLFSCLPSHPIFVSHLLFTVCYVVFLASPCHHIFIVCYCPLLCFARNPVQPRPMYVLRTCFSFYCHCFLVLSSVAFLLWRCEIQSQSISLLIEIWKMFIQQKHPEY